MKHTKNYVALLNTNTIVRYHVGQQNIIQIMLNGGDIYVFCYTM